MPDSYRPLCAAAAGAAARREMARSKHRSKKPAPSKKPAGARRFRRGDEQVRAVSSFANLDDLSARHLNWHFLGRPLPPDCALSYI